LQKGISADAKVNIQKITDEKIAHVCGNDILLIWLTSGLIRKQDGRKNYSSGHLVIIEKY